MPSFCKVVLGYNLPSSNNNNNDEEKASNGLIITLVVIIGLVILLVAFFIYKRIIRMHMQKVLDEKVTEAVSKYVDMKDSEH